MWKIKTVIEIFTFSLYTYSIDLFFTFNILISFADLFWVFLKYLIVNECKKKDVLSLLFNLFFEFVSIYDFFKVSESFSSVIEDLRLFDSFAYDFIEDNLESKWYSWTIKIVVIIFANFLYFGISTFLSLFL